MITTSHSLSHNDQSITNLQYFTCMPDFSDFISVVLTRRLLGIFVFIPRGPAAHLPLRYWQNTTSASFTCQDNEHFLTNFFCQHKRRSLNMRWNKNKKKSEDRKYGHESNVINAISNSEFRDRWKKKWKLMSKSKWGRREYEGSEIKPDIKENLRRVK